MVTSDFFHLFYIQVMKDFWSPATGQHKQSAFGSEVLVHTQWGSTKGHWKCFGYTPPKLLHGQSRLLGLYD